MIEFIYTGCVEHNHVTCAELLNGLEYSHEIILSGHSLRHIVCGMTTLKWVV
jgi:hypothetical protein